MLLWNDALGDAALRSNRVEMESASVQGWTTKRHMR